jgi:hypothetical protein
MLRNSEQVGDVVELGDERASSRARAVPELKVGFAVLLLVSLMFMLTGCGISHEAAQGCGSSFKGICHGLLGPDDVPLDERLDEIEGRLDDVEARVGELESDYGLLAGFVNVLDAQLSGLIAIVAALDGTLTSITDGLQAQIDALSLQVVALQDQADQTAIEVVELSTEYRITELLDPCGNGAGFDEVLLRTSGGDIIAYFEQGANRFLSVLTPGSYRTTDGTNCNFSIDSQKRLCDNLGCR